MSTRNLAWYIPAMVLYVLILLSHAIIMVYTKNTSALFLSVLSSRIAEVPRLCTEGILMPLVFRFSTQQRKGETDEKVFVEVVNMYYMARCKGGSNGNVGDR